MTTLLLVGRETTAAREVLESHAQRLRRRCAVDSVHVTTYSDDPYRELRTSLTGIESDETYVVPMCAGHTNETTTDLPAALTQIDGTVHYCEPVGNDPAITEAIRDRARAAVEPDAGVSLVLVGLGNTSSAHHRGVLESHAQRLRERTAYEAVRECYLVQNPAVECVRYNVPTERAVAVPLFILPGETTAKRIPDKLGVDRGGFVCTDPLGTHEKVTDAVESILDARTAMAKDTRPVTFEDALATTSRPVATDGDGR